MDVQLLEKLQAPFSSEDVKQRKGSGSRVYEYIAIGDVIRRVLIETKGAYSWEVVSLYENNGSWICHGRIGVDGHSFDGIGTHPAQDVESPKAAESDSFKRAAVKIGVALHLQTDDVVSPNGSKPVSSEETKAQVDALIWEGPGQCPSCHAPAGKLHGVKCRS